MPYLIDGHNLIPKVPGLNLNEFDDEQALIELLVTFCNRRRQQVEVFFDNAPAGGSPVRTFGGLVTARFIRQGKTADEAIRLRLERLGRQSRNWTVVSSDHAVQASARHAQARLLTSDAFAALMQLQVDDQAIDRGADPDAGVRPEDIDDWLKLFGEKN